MEEKILVLDIETDALNANTIYVCVTKDLQTGDVSFYREPDKLLVELKKYDYYVGHNILSFDAPILIRLEILLFFHSCLILIEKANTVLLPLLLLWE